MAVVSSKLENHVKTHHKVVREFSHGRDMNFFIKTSLSMKFNVLAAKEVRNFRNSDEMIPKALEPSKR